MSVVVVLVLRAGTELHEDDDHGVGEQVAEGMDAVGNHCRRLSHKACYELEDYKQDIYRRTIQRNACGALLSVCFHITTKNYIRQK